MLDVIRRKLHSARIRWHRAHALGLTWHGGAYLPVFEQKHMLNALLRGAGLATVTDLALVRANRVEMLHSPKTDNVLQVALEDYFASLAPGRYFVKPAVGEHGRDAGCLDRAASGFEFNGQAIESAELIKRYAAYPCGFLVQRWQEQHPGLARLSANTLNTLRILTLSPAGVKPRAIHAVLRVGRNGAWLDNFHAGGIALRVDLETGRTIAPAVRLDRAESYTHHPDSGLELDAQPVPDFELARALVCSAHALFSEIPTIGWDVAIAPDGPRIVEGNLNWDAEIHTFVDAGFRAMILSELKKGGDVRAQNLPRESVGQ